MKPIGAAIGITIIAGTTEGAYQVQHRSDNEVISKGLNAASIREHGTYLRRLNVEAEVTHFERSMGRS